MASTKVDYYQEDIEETYITKKKRVTKVVQNSHHSYFSDMVFWKNHISFLQFINLEKLQSFPLIVNKCQLFLAFCKKKIYHTSGCAIF